MRRCDCSECLFFWLAGTIASGSRLASGIGRSSLDSDKGLPVITSGVKETSSSWLLSTLLLHMLVKLARSDAESEAPVSEMGLSRALDKDKGKVLIKMIKFEVLTKLSPEQFCCTLTIN